MLVPAGRLEALPERRAVAFGDGRAVVVRVGAEVCAYRNQCLHQASPLDGAWVRDGVLTCPLHFWRYDVADGTCRNGTGRLDTHPVTIVDGEVLVDLPEPPPPVPLREHLLAHARDWTRGD
ncbi:MAG TPA: Rieske (2Fe-2S) protein [Ilumatobacter sp.]|nr:Rieske (2Fe-2S) protein [Ilumatobacter sp.]